MGYPMTYRRVVNRNGLAEGDYGEQGHLLNWPTCSWNLDMPDAEDYFANSPDFIRDLKNLRSQVQRLLGDLRRLERDAVDERAVCGEITRRTGIDANFVAAVLKEFLAI